ncbi:MAG: uroporphyrinogen-III synthase [Rhodobacterales bacterium]|nr:MAG: uroporphyrinogen-III synthase [Rhodobacterales bacterium]
MTDNPTRRPTLLLTRPEAQSRQMAATFAGRAEVVISPIMEIRPTGAAVSLAGVAGVILTSANAVRFAPPLESIKAHCVGLRTAEAARAAGAEVVTVAPDAAALVAAVSGPGPLMHLRGEHARGEVAARLDRAGTETHEVVVYAQIARALSAEARGLLESTNPVVLPLYSPRSARLVGQGLVPGPDLRAIAMSPAVGDAWSAATGGRADICATPTGGAMVEKILAALARKLP